MRRVLALVLLAALLVGYIPLTAHAAYENTHVNTGDQRSDIVSVALTQVGYQEGKGSGVWNNDTKYGDWAGWPKTEWCGWFVSWCARQAGVPTSVLRTNGVARPSSFGISSYYSSSEYTPRPGDLFFKKNFNHVGIVYYVDGNYFYSIEGNTSTSGWEGHSVMSRRHALNEFYFASPAYTSDSGSSTPTTHTHNYQKAYESAHPHKEYAKCACGNSYYTGQTRTSDSCTTCKRLNCTHSYGSWQNADSSNHQKVCSKCGDKVTQSHQWEELEITKEPTCKDEGERKLGCTQCDRTKNEPVEKLEEHIYKNWILVDQEKHMRMCEYCDDTQVASHELMIGRDGTPFWIRGDSTHWHQCADCGMKLQEANHSLQQEFDQENHWQTCLECGIRFHKTPHNYLHECYTDCNACPHVRQIQHIYAQQVSMDNNNHWYACINCGERTGLAAHQYVMIPWENDSQLEICQDCGRLTGKVIVPTEWQRLQKKALASLSTAGRWVLPPQLEDKWYPIAGGTLLLLGLAILILIPCLIVRSVKKRRKNKVGTP